VLLRQGPSISQARPFDALRPGSLALPSQPRRPHRPAQSEAAGLSGYEEDRGLADVGPADLPLGQVAGGHGRVRTLGLGTAGLGQGVAVVPNTGLRWDRRERVYRRRDPSEYGGFHLLRRYALYMGAQH